MGHLGKNSQGNKKVPQNAMTTGLMLEASLPEGRDCSQDNGTGISSPLK